MRESFASQDWKVTANTTDRRLVQIRRRAKYFANICKVTNMAYRLPDLFIDSIDDSELNYVKAYLVDACGVVKRQDGFWEEKK